ncbi:hypothetical protein sos41_36710 [Alphaproteobacteria bacterium SO-S41]|nr:hypothetical protein sos41_36710 [Alphaproteobacteria bacterium SO-S41]
MTGARPPREPVWLPVDRDRRFAGRWVELTYAASFLADPVRPTLRFTLAGAEEYVILPAPVCGRAIWRGRFPAGAEVAIDPGPGVTQDRFRVEPIRVLAMTSLAARAARSPRAGLVGLVQHAAGRREGSRRKLAVALHDEPLESYDLWRRARRREPEPAGLDRLSDDMATAAPIRFTGVDAGHRGWRETLISLQRQSCPRWELLLVAAGERETETLKRDSALAAEPRVAIVASAAASGSVSLATVALEAGDRVAPEAVAALISTFQREPDIAALTFDEDEPGIVARSRRPLFRWPQPPALEGRAARRSAAPPGGGRVHHLARVLIYRARPEGERSSPLAHLPAPSSDLPSVDVVVPTRDRPDMLMRCMESLLKKTNYPRLNVIVADNDTVDPVARRYLDSIAADPRVSVVPVPGAFNFAAICNTAAARGKSELLVFLNNDVEAIDPGWLEKLADTAMQPGNGAVGAKLFYPAGGIQHAGIVLGLHGAAGHFYRGAKRGETGYRRALAMPHRVAAVTGACLAVRRSLFAEVGGFDEASFAVEFNDIDLCLRLDALGHATVWRPDVELVHFESATRGRPSLASGQRHADQRQRFLKRWRDAIANDPYFHPAFSLASETPRLA